ncbi:unnamed protein product [Tuber aestivum]|uniref:Nephrocystin 3-like N-terminal domain-containing protein n=1 Tax=Tuber aestivum TaxID=59557 RepID=A0A292Q0H5_9PEZI|nr:unnamed protein product [Tuber aestivum]
MQSVNFGDGNAHCGNITGSFNIYKSDEDARILRWLSPLEPNHRHQGVRNDRYDGVGDWFLEISEFREWRSSEGGGDGAVLFCSGNPGVGKTCLSSLVIDQLCDQAKKKDIAVACFYCDYKAQQEQTTTSMVGAILKQLVGRRDIPDYVRGAFQEAKKEIGGRGLRLADLMGMLRIAIASIHQAFICIDALDECLPQHLPELLESLRDIVRESPGVRVFLTGRPHIKEEIQRYFSQAVVVPVSPNKDDIRSYVERRLDRDAEHEAMNEELRVDIVRTIVEKISDMWVAAFRIPPPFNDVY